MMEGMEAFNTRTVALEGEPSNSSTRSLCSAVRSARDVRQQLGFQPVQRQPLTRSRAAARGGSRRRCRNSMKRS